MRRTALVPASRYQFGITRAANAPPPLPRQWRTLGDPTVNDSKVGVHVTHCCAVCGCKYGNDDCPVATKQLPAAYKCQDCEEIPVYTRAELDAAVMAERARCAALCEAEHVGRDLYDEELDDSDLAYNNAVRDCARAIRQPAAPMEAT